MDLQNMLHDVAMLANAISVLVLAVGYYFMIKLYRKWLRQSRESRIAGGRPMVVVNTDYSHLPEVSIVVRNFNKAPAKEVSFEFSAPVADAGGSVLSEPPYLKKGLPFLEPEGEITRFWGRLPDLAPVLRERGLEGGIEVTTRYKDLAGESYSTDWTLDPLLFEDSGIGNQKGMNDLVDSVGKITEEGVGQNGRRRAVSRNGS